MTRILKLGAEIVGSCSRSTASAQSNIRNARLETRPGADLAGTFPPCRTRPETLWMR